ncbi:MAG TPA: 1,2-phenylacetyl-CoA epoxidase subunit PaaB [Anaerolineales bacterium]|nr:1,2-phenylacetyl-CoA epoxidase subunit PaaB [Anaerolineales bacterium]
MPDTQWEVYEVFHQKARGEQHVHVGSVHAPNPEMALVLAKEQYARRMACVNLWVVKASDIHASEYADQDMFRHATDKSYREAYGYKVVKKVRCEREGTEGNERTEE